MQIKPAMYKKSPLGNSQKPINPSLYKTNLNFENKFTRYKIKLTLNPPTNEYGLYKLWEIKTGLLEERVSFLRHCPGGPEAKHTSGPKKPAGAEAWNKARIRSIFPSQKPGSAALSQPICMRRIKKAKSSFDFFFFLVFSSIVAHICAANSTREIRGIRFKVRGIRGKSEG